MFRGRPFTKIVQIIQNLADVHISGKNFKNLNVQKKYLKLKEIWCPDCSSKADLLKSMATGRRALNMFKVKTLKNLLVSITA